MVRRDLTVAALTLCASAAIFGLGQEQAQALLRSSVYEWDAMKVQPREFGTRREFFQGSTPALKELSVWVTSLNPGQSSHAPHRHAEPEILIVKEGRVEFVRDGVRQELGAGAVVLQVGEELHGTRNTSDRPVSYYVIRVRTP